MKNIRVLSYVLLLAGCGLGVLLIRLVVPDATPPSDREALLALAAPRTTVAGDRYVMYGGVAVEAEGSYVVRLCADSGGCPIRRSVVPAGPADTWGWFATYPASLPVGTYHGEVFVQHAGSLGAQRTVEYYQWIHYVE